jgi:hypothetical protein
MNESMDRALVDWLAEGPDRGSPEALSRTLAATRRTSQRPGWTIRERWFSVQLTMQRVPAMRPILFLLVIGLLVLAIVAVLLLGSQRRVPAPFGPAANGLVAFDAGGGVYVAQSDGTAARRIQGGDAFSLSPAFSRDGTRLAFFSSGTTNADPHLYVADADGSSAARLIGDRVTLAGRHDVSPAWSADGKHIYFSGTTPDSQALPVLVAVDTDSGKASTLGAAKPRGAVIVSPDGKWLAYRSDATGKAALTVMPAEGGTERTLATAAADTDAFMSISWSPDSRRVVAHHDDRVETVGLDGNASRVSGEGVAAFYPTWSPDGSWIAYWADTAIGDSMVIADPQGGSKRILGRVGGCTMNWSPDSKYLFGYTTNCSSSKLTRVPIDDPTQAVVFDIPGITTGVSSWQRIAPEP